MDAMEQLVWDSEIAFGVVGSNGEFILIPLNGDKADDGTLNEKARAKGYRFCGVLTARGGVPSAKCEPHRDCIETMMHAALAFARIVADRIQQQPADDFVTWATKLHSLEDPR